MDRLLIIFNLENMSALGRIHLKINEKETSFAPDSLTSFYAESILKISSIEQKL